jgi:phage-related minor tail protein
MMEPLSGAASVIAVIQLTGKIVEICGGYINKAKNARQDILQLQQEIWGLTEVLKMLDNLLRGPDGLRLTTSQKLFDDVEKCSSTLTELKEKIDPDTTQGPMRRLGLRALKWPLKRGEVVEAINDIEGYQSLFSLALQVDQM